MTRTVPAAPRSLQTPAAAPLTVDRLGAHHGAQVSGIDLATASDAQIAAVRAALVEHEVLFSSGQDLDEEHPEIYARDAADNGFADVWHTDVTFVRRPPPGSILRAVQVPDVGGDTQWADAEAACASLSPAVRVLADRLTAVHDGTREFGYYLAHRGGNRWDGEDYARLEPIEHPVVRVHPETGRRCLFVNPGFTSHIAGVSDAESRGLLDLFYAHLTKPEHIVRHRWHVGDVAVWDNRATLHHADRDYGDFRRIMHRVTRRGDAPVGPAGR